MIDFHTHTFPERIAAMAIAKLQQASHSRAFTDGTAEGLQASMARAGIELSVVLPVATNPVKVGKMNDVSIAMNAQGGSLHYFGCMHPDAEDWHAELARIAAAGLKGIKLHPVYQGVDIDDPRNLRILQRAGELGLTVVIHAGDDIGFPGEVRCSPRMIRNALRQAGPVQLVCAHMGGWRNWQEVVENLLDTSALLDTAFTLGAIAPIDDHYAPHELPMLPAEDFLHLVRAFGAERIVFGSDSPWDDQAQAVAALRALPLTAQEQADIFHNTAAKLLNL